MKNDRSSDLSFFVLNCQNIQNITNKACEGIYFLFVVSLFINDLSRAHDKHPI
jgi:hypothetical protein